MPYYTYLNLAEAFGGLAVLIITIAKVLTATVELRILESDLISNFYQVEKPNEKFEENKARSEAPPIAGIRGTKKIGKAVRNDEEAV